VSSKVWFFIASILILAGCNFPPTFSPEYKDSTINFIQDRAIEVPPPATDDGSTVALDSPARWDWAWRGRTSSSFEYMTLTGSAEPGPDSESAVWLLEIVNLSDNAVSTATAGWQAVGSNATIASLSGSLHGSALKINASEDSHIKALNSLYKDIDATPHSYKMSLMLLNSNSFRFYSGSSFNKLEVQNFSWQSDDTYNTIPLIITNIATSSSNFAALYTNGADVYIDDVHLIRADIELNRWALRLILRQNDTTPILVPGMYELTLYVKKPSGYTFPSEASCGDSNLYASQYIKLRMVQVTDNSILAEEIFDMSANSAEWNQLRLRFPKGKALKFSEGTDESILAIEILPFSTAKPFAGAVLIAKPELHFYINGYTD